MVLLQQKKEKKKDMQLSRQEPSPTLDGLASGGPAASLQARAALSFSSFPLLRRCATFILSKPWQTSPQPDWRLYDVQAIALGKKLTATFGEEQASEPQVLCIDRSNVL